MTPRRLQPGDGERLWKPRELAAVMRVDPKTPTRWARDGLVPCIRTPGGSVRFKDSVVRAIRNGEEFPDG